jgi:branched-chain amino acid aminotransferase
MDAVFETMLVDDGRVRLLDRHLGRLRRAGVPEERVADVHVAVLDALQMPGPVVVRIDVAAAGVVIRPRPPRAPTPVSGVVVLAYDPSDPSREQKRSERAWAAAAEAAAGGEALLVSGDGLVGETTRANVFAILGDEVVTPAVAGILPGVTRSFAIERAGAIERPLLLAELRAADGAFLTTAGRGIVPLADVDGDAIPTHPLVADLQAAWRAL